MPLFSSPLTPDRNQTPDVTYAVRPSGPSDCRSFLCVKMRSSRCHSDLILSKSTPSWPNPVVDRAPCFDAQYGLHSLGVEAQRLPTLAPGHIEAGVDQKPGRLLKQVRCQLHALAFSGASAHACRHLDSFWSPLQDTSHQTICDDLIGIVLVKTN